MCLRANVLFLLIFLQLDIEYIQGNIKNLGWRGNRTPSRQKNSFTWNLLLRFSSSSLDPFSAEVVDTVVMNPPFGTRQKGADMNFLSVALKVSAGTGL